jgi:hypothetical protein
VEFMVKIDLPRSGEEAIKINKRTRREKCK